MITKSAQRSAGFLAVCLLFIFERTARPVAGPLLDSRVHKNGKLWVEVTNFGQFGTDGRQRGAIWPGTDLAGREARYINRGGMFLGGIVPSDGTAGPDLNPIGDLDTLVAEGLSAWSVVDFRETFPHYSDSRSAVQVRSSLTNSQFYSPAAVSEEDFVTVYTDTFLSAKGARFVPPKHQRALGIEVIEKSYQFSLPFAEDIVFFDLVFKNIGKNYIRNFYAGFFADNDMQCLGVPQDGLTPGTDGQQDDATGFMVVNSTGDTVNTAWVVEPDGDYGCMAGVVGVRVLRPTTRDGRVSFNWWMSDTDINTKDDWGPVTRNIYTGESNSRDPIGSPQTDPEKYILLSNGSFDDPQFDPIRKEFNPNIPGGVDPNDNSRFLISFGPLGSRDSTIADPADKMFGQTVKILAPGDSVLFTYAVIGGEGDGAVASALRSFDPLSFVVWAKMPLSPPLCSTIRVDTDGDGYKGDDLDGDGIIDTGDRVPDFKGPPPPPSPPLRTILGDRTITLDWSAADPKSPGYDTNDPTLPLNFKDPFISDDPNTPEDESKDFEGFRVLRSKSGILGSFEVLAEFDLADNEIGKNTGLVFKYTDHVPNGEQFYYAVVSFDRGAPSFGIETLESSALINLTQLAASLPPTGTFGDQPVWVEPNPYIERSGFEDTQLPDQRAIENFRIIDFVNVPSPCTIRVFTVDGDLVQTLQHNDANSSRARWNLLSRNTRPIASGIYIYAVETPSGERRMGRFVVVK
jgi:hypothetical protein